MWFLESLNRGNNSSFRPLLFKNKILKYLYKFIRYMLSCSILLSSNNYIRGQFISLNKKITKEDF